MQKNDGYNLVFIRRGLRMAWRPLKRTFKPLLASNLSWKRPTRGKARKRPLWRFFRPRHILGYKPPAPPSNITGGGSYALPYIRRGLRIWFRPRHVYPPPPPVLQYVLNDPDWWRMRRRSWIVNTARFAILQPLGPLSQKSRPTIRFRQKRPLWRFFRPRHILGYNPPLPPLISNLTGGGTYALPYVSRRLRSQFRPRHLLVTIQPVRLSFNPPPPRYRARRPLWKFFRPRHLFAPPSPPPQLVLYKRPQRFRFHRLLSRFFRPKHISIFRPPLYAFRVFRAPLRFKQKHPLWRFFRPRHVLGYVPPQAASVFPRKPGPRPRIRRGRINVLRFKKNMYAFSFTPPSLPSAADWLTRYRRRGRR